MSSARISSATNPTTQSAARLMAVQTYSFSAAYPIRRHMTHPYHTRPDARNV